MDTLPHDGAVITLLTITGLGHRQSCKDIVAMLVATLTALFIIGVFYATSLV